ncbi:hypothetical protein SAMN05216284_114164 [Micromonospora sediminimaris]|nr:hypothetical protein SAMN05216284_114164 [Micromonospora sediminimaris]
MAACRSADAGVGLRAGVRRGRAGQSPRGAPQLHPGGRRRPRRARCRPPGRTHGTGVSRRRRSRPSARCPDRPSAWSGQSAGPGSLGRTHGLPGRALHAVEAARGVDGSTGAARLPLGVTACRRPAHFRRPWSGDRPSRARCPPGGRCAGATGRSRRTADLGRAGAARPATDPAVVHRASRSSAAGHTNPSHSSAADTATPHRGAADSAASDCRAADPAAARRAANRGAAGSAAHPTSIRCTAWPTARTAVGGATVSHGTICPAAGPNAARRSCAAGGTAGPDRFS